MRPQAIVLHSEVLLALEPLALDADTALFVANKLLPIIGKYLGHKWQAEERLAHAASLRTLLEITKGSAKLATQLKGLKNEYLVAIESARATPDFDPSMFDFHQLVPILERLSEAAARAKAEIAPRRRGRPNSADRDDTIRDLLKLLELPSMKAVGFPVELSESGSRDPQRRQLKGRGGELLLAIFKRFDPHFDEPAIWGSVARVRRLEPGR